MIHNWENYFDISSEYWLKVEKIYEDSESFPKKVVKDRNLHHKFPRSFSKKDGVDIDNDEGNLVSLSLADHFRVHYYLWKCSKKGYRGMMAKAFVFMRKKVVVYASDDTIEQLAKDYEDAMREAAKAMSRSMKGEKHPMYGKHHSEESKKKNSEAHKGKKLSEEHKKKIGAVWKGKHHSEETKKKIREVRKGHPVSEETRKKLSEVHKGRPVSEETKKKLSDAHKGQVAWNKGKQLSEETRKKMCEANKGKNIGNTNVRGTRWFNNGKINIRAKECPEGFIPGRIK